MLTTQFIYKSLKFTNLIFATSFLFFSVLVATNIELVSPSILIGANLGKLSLFLLIITLAPGIAKRFGVFPLLIRYLMPLRRQFGIAMYLSALAHSILIFTAPNIAINNFPPSTIEPFILFGSIALITYFPLFVTSNDTSVRLLKHWWSKVHKLTYLGLFFITIHLLLQPSNYSLIAGLALTLEILSYTYFYIRARKNNPQHDPN